MGYVIRVGCGMRNQNTDLERSPNKFSTFARDIPSTLEDFVLHY
jgi:hypothetical protein